ncbi:MAG: fibronectin type III domain-containing protein [Fibrobacter sp.]|nr:fibronectin type III domain-containing protein [Fibrobacter sp.]
MKILLGIILSLVFWSCGPDKQGKEYSFERSIQEPLVEKRCIDSKAKDECYLLKWRLPVNTKNFSNVHVWIDTTVLSAEEQDIKKSYLEQSIVHPFKVKDGYFFDSLDISDYVNAFKDRDSISIALWGEYKGVKVPGRIVRTFVILGDDIPPARVKFSDSLTHNQMIIHWSRPTDQRDFYQATDISGPIAGYDVHLWSDDGSELGSEVKAELSIAGQKSEADLHLGKYWLVRGRGELSLAVASSRDSERHWAITDGQGFAQDDSLANIFTLEVTGLKPNTSFQINIAAYDSAGNLSVSETPVLSTTDSVPPLMAQKFVFLRDTLDSERVAVDSNRVYLWWLAGIDPLFPNSGIELDSNLFIPEECHKSKCWQEVENYQLEALIRGKWGRLEPSSVLSEKNYSQRWSISEDSIYISSEGNYVADTLLWMIPGDTLILRVRSVDSSGAVSPWFQDTMLLSRRSFVDFECPIAYAPVVRSVTEEQRDVFCMEKFEHRDLEAVFQTNLLYQEARQACQNLSEPGFSFDLCSEEDWRLACLSGGSRYGTIEDELFIPQEFLFRNCNVGTGDSAQAFNIETRNARCVNPEGIYDLPGQLQEWVRGVDFEVDSLSNDTIYDTIPLLKGASYMVFDVSDRTLQARCTAKSHPARMRANYRQDSIYIYRNGSFFDTLFQVDTNRQLVKTLSPAELPDTIIVFEVRDPQSGEVLGEDFVDQREYRRRGGLDWIEHLSGGFDYVQIRTEAVLLLGGESPARRTAYYYRDPSIGFRCCAYPEN